MKETIKLSVGIVLVAVGSIVAATTNYSSALPDAGFSWRGAFFALGIGVAIFGGGMIIAALMNMKRLGILWFVAAAVVFGVFASSCSANGSMW